MTQNNEKPEPAQPIYSEETCGRLLRRLNLMCVKAHESGDHDAAKQAATYSSQVEEAMMFSGIV